MEKTYSKHQKNSICQEPPDNCHGSNTAFCYTGVWNRKQMVSQKSLDYQILSFKCIALLGESSNTSLEGKLLTEEHKQNIIGKIQVGVTHINTQLQVSHTVSVISGHTELGIKIASLQQSKY